MSQPPYPYNRIFDFESFSINTPAAQQPGVQLEGEYDAIKRTLDGLISRLAEIQRADGKIDGNALSTETYASIYSALIVLLQPTFNLYLLKTGGTINGKLTVNTDLSNPSLNIGSNKNAGTYLNAVAGDVWISQQVMFYKDGNGNLRQTVALNTSNSFTNYQSISQGDNVYPSLSVTQTKDAGALLVTNTGLGYSFKVEDSASPDGTPFLIDNAGHVGVGVTPSTAVGLSVDSTGILFSPSATPQTVPFLPSAVALTGGTIGTGVTVTTAAALDNTTKIASTAFVTTANNLKANLASPTFTGTVLAPTALLTDNSTTVATTAFVKGQAYVSASALSSYAPLASPSLTGVPVAPTATAGTNTTQIATTAFVTTADNLKANLASPTFTGIPAAPTASANTNTTQIATTAYVTAADALKSNLDSPTFTGTPRAPTATAGINSTQIATTAFVTTADNLKANLDSPTFTGTPRVPTPAANDNGTKIASTEFVKTAISSLVASAPATLDTLNELATALGNDPSFATTVTNSIATKLSIATAASTYGTIENLNLKAPIESPTFTGDPKAPTPLTSDNDTSIATTAFVKAQAYATLASPTFTGDPKAPTPVTSDNDTSIATTAFVKAQGYLTSAPVTSVEGRTGAVTISVTDVVGTDTNSGGGLNINTDSYTSHPWGGYRVERTVNDGAGNYTQIAQFNPYGLNIVTEDNPSGDWQFAMGKDGIRFRDTSIQTTAGLPLTGGTMSGAIGFDAVGTQNIAKGSFDSSRGGYNGISLNCAVGYELNWQAGWLKAVQIGGGVVPINFDSNINVEANGSRAFIDPTEVYTTRFDATGTNANAYGAIFNGGVEVGDASGKWAELTPTSLRFGDTTIQTTAALPLTGGTVAGKLNINNGTSDTPSLAVTQTGNGGGMIVTNTGSGYSFKVEDATSPDATPFAIDASGRVGIGVTPDATVALKVDSTGIKFNDDTTISSAEQYLPFNRLGDFNFTTAGNWTGISSGGALNQNGWTKSAINLTTLGYCAYHFQPSYINRAWGNGNYCSWNVKTDISFRPIISTNNNTTNDQIVRIGYGKSGNAYVAGDLANKGVGIRKIGQGFIELMVHDGTTFRTVTSSYNNGNNSGGFDAKISLNGLGKADLYINGNIVATSNNAPVGTSSTFFNYLFIENQTLSAVVSPTVSVQVVVAGFHISTI